MILYLYDVSSMYLSYTSKSPTVHVPVLYPLYHYNFIHTHTVVVYTYHMRMTAKAVNTLELVHNCINAADSYNRTQLYKSQLYEVRFYTRSYKMQLRITNGLHNSYSRNLGKCTNVHYAHIIYYERCGMLFPFIRSPIYMSLQDTLDRSHDHFLPVVFLLACNHKTTHF